MNTLKILCVAGLLFGSGSSMVFAQCPQPSAITGDTVGLSFGYSVAMGGDYNGDGYADYIVGTPFSDVPVGNAGLAQVYSGLTGAVLHSIEGAFSGARIGVAVADAGDLNNDGVDDFLVSQVDSATVYAFDGATLSTLFRYYDPLVSSDQFGSSIAAAGDVNNDGFDDVIIGAAGYDSAGVDRGRAYVFFGVDTVLGFARSRDQADLIFTGEGADDFFGYAVAGGVDIDNDGYDDLIVGAPEFNVDTGYVHVYSGFSGGLHYRLGGTAPLSQLGRAVVGLGYVDGDSLADFAVGAPLRGAGSEGRVVVVSGATGGPIRVFDGPVPGARVGISLATAGDVDGDGSPDLAIGSLIDTVWVISPATGFARALYSGGPEGFLYGERVSGGGDVNGDGYTDLIVADRTDSAGIGPDVGAAYVVYLGDQDTDEWEDFCDNCPATFNPGQLDTNGNSIGDICEVPDSLFFYLFSPVNMVVTDPAGDSIGVDSVSGALFNTILNGSTYDTLTDFNGDLGRDDIVSIPNPIAGDYSVRIFREDGVPDSAKFTLAIRINGNQLLEDEAYQNAEVAALGTTIPSTFVWTAATTLPGDANADGVTNSADIIFMVNRVFKGGPGTPVPGHGDVNCDGVETSSDIIYLVNYVFKGGTTPCSQTGG